MKKNILLLIAICISTNMVYAQKQKKFINIIEQDGKDLRYASLLLLGGQEYIEYQKRLRQEELKNTYNLDYYSALITKVKHSVKLLNKEELYKLYKIDNANMKLPLSINYSLCNICETLLINPENIESVKLITDNGDKRIEVLTKDRPLGKTIK